MFKKILASVGIGGAKVDTRLHHSQYEAGGMVSGEILIKGGSTAQKIDGINIRLMTRSRDEEGTYHYIELEDYRIVDEFSLEANEDLTVNFEFPLPPDVPISMYETKVWLKTVMDVDNAVDPSDNDTIEILPHPLVQGVFNAFDRLGLRLNECDNVFAHPQMQARLPIVQEFEFKPTSHLREMEEVEVIFIVRDDNIVELFLEIDGRGGWFTEGHERLIHINLEAADLQNVDEAAANFEGLFLENI